MKDHLPESLRFRKGNSKKEIANQVSRNTRTSISGLGHNKKARPLPRIQNGKFLSVDTGYNVFHHMMWELEKVN